jgi:hypothetical protein
MMGVTNPFSGDDGSGGGGGWKYKKEMININFKINILNMDKYPPPLKLQPTGTG